MCSRKWNAQLMCSRTVYSRLQILQLQVNIFSARFVLSLGAGPLIFFFNYVMNSEPSCVPREGIASATCVLSSISLSFFSFFFFWLQMQTWLEDSDSPKDSIIEHRSLWESYSMRLGSNQKKGKKKRGSLYRTYGTRVVPV